MTLLIAVFAAIISTVIWYVKDSHNQMKVGTLALMFWGVSLMWLCDAVFEFAELKEKFFHPAAAEVFNDFFLGISVVAVALVIWLVLLLIKDPRGVVRQALTKK